MLIYLADDEPLLLDALNNSVHAAEPTAEVKAFEWATPLLDEIRKTNDQPDIAFLDVEMPGMSGMEAARELKRLSPNTRLVFVTGFTQYAVEAFSIRADGYVMKPVSAKKIREEFDHLCPIPQTRTPKRIRAQCFGNFEIFLDGKPIHFQYNKTKEMLAYLIDRKGALCTNGELMAVLWEDDSGDERKKEYFRKLRADLQNKLKDSGIDTLLIQHRGLLGLATEELDCDYYDWLTGTSQCENIYNGEYMAQYSWAEMTLCFPEK